MKLTKNEAIRMLVSQPEHPPVKLEFLDGTFRHVSALEAYDRIIASPLAYRSRFGKLHKLKCLPAAVAPVKTTIAKWEACYRNSEAPVLQAASHEWFQGNGYFDHDLGYDSLFDRIEPAELTA